MELRFLCDKTITRKLSVSLFDFTHYPDEISLIDIYLFFVNIELWIDLEDA